MTEHERHAQWSQEHHGGQAQEPEEVPVPTPGHDTTQRDFPARGSLWGWGED